MHSIRLWETAYLCMHVFFCLSEWRIIDINHFHFVGSGWTRAFYGWASLNFPSDFNRKLAFLSLSSEKRTPLNNDEVDIFQLFSGAGKKKRDLLFPFIFFLSTLLRGWSCSTDLLVSEWTDLLVSEWTDWLVWENEIMAPLHDKNCSEHGDQIGRIFAAGVTV
jgi:hypothetical protein